VVSGTPCGTLRIAVNPLPGDQVDNGPAIPATSRLLHGDGPCGLYRGVRGVYHELDLPNQLQVITILTCTLSLFLVFILNFSVRRELVE